MRQIIKYKKQNIQKENIIYCDAIILTTGGNGHDFGEKGYLKEFAPQIMKFPSTNGHKSTGSGIKLGREIGADLVDMQQIQFIQLDLLTQKTDLQKINL